MNLGDVMRELGDGPLKNHTWTQPILDALNAILPSASLLTEDSTGRQVLMATATLPDDERSRLLSSTVDLLQGTFTLSTSSTDVPPTVETKSESFHQIIMGDLIANPTKALMLFFASMIVMLSVVMAVVMTWGYTKTGKAPDTSLFTTLIRALVDILNAFSSSSGH